MKSKAGEREMTCLSLIYSIVPIMTVLAGVGANLMAGGAIVNSLLCFIVVLLMLKPIKNYFKLWGNVKVTDALKDSFSAPVSFIIGITFLTLFSISCVCSLSICTTQISDLTLNVISSDNIRIIVSLSATFLALLGIEALTRHSYVILFVGYILMGTLIYASFRGWNTDNLYPLCGVSVKETFTNYIGICIFSSVAPMLFMCNSLKSREETYKCIKKTVIISNVIMILTLLIYTLTVPYPVGKLYSHSLEAIFSSGSSGDVFHRFEIFLISLFTLFALVSVSYSIIVCTKILKNLFGFTDSRPLVLLVGVLFGSLSGFGWSAREYIFSGIFLAVLSFFVPLILYIRKKSEKKAVDL
ncbi:MAG: hypothetical protein E7394_05325 [Ruminococcaceae bacterium]|nr:hypothetical protein [Oscillospiraceae bacterium]